MGREGGRGEWMGEKGRRGEGEKGRRGEGKKGRREEGEKGCTTTTTTTTTTTVVVVGIVSIIITIIIVSIPINPTIGTYTPSTRSPKRNEPLLFSSPPSLPPSLPLTHHNRPPQASPTPNRTNPRNDAVLTSRSPLVSQLPH
jgi:hypothetical protein